MKLSMDVQHYHEYEYANADIIMSMIFFSLQLSCAIHHMLPLVRRSRRSPLPRWTVAGLPRSPRRDPRGV